MQAIEFWKLITMDKANLLDQLITLLEENKLPFCVIGGQAVNAYVEPLVSLDLDLVIAAELMETAENLLRRHFTIKRFPHSLNLSRVGSDLRVQIHTDPRYAAFINRAEPREVLGKLLPVAALEDVFQGKIWAVQDAERRSSKRQKDLADIARLIEAYPDLRKQVPETILSLLVE